MKAKEKFLTILSIVSTYLITFTVNVSARAGRSSHSSGHSSSHRSSTSHYRRSYYGSGGYSSASSTITFVILIFIAVALMFVFKSKFKPSYSSLKKKKNVVQAKLSFLKQNDLAWDYDFIKKNFTDAFMSVQKAWSERDMSLADEYISKKIRSSYDLKLKAMKMKHEINILEDIDIIEFFPVAARDKNLFIPHKTLSIFVRASLIDYTADDRTSIIKSGSNDRTSFTEVWDFIYKNDKWILNGIQQTK